MGGDPVGSTASDQDVIAYVATDATDDGNLVELFPHQRQELLAESFAILAGLSAQELARAVSALRRRGWRQAADGPVREGS